WLACNQIDRSSRRVATIQGSLRAAQYFYTFEIEKRSQLGLGTSHNRAVHVKRYTRLTSSCRCVCPYAPNEYLGDVEIGAEGDARCDELQVSKIVDVRVLQAIAAERSHSSAHLLKGLLPFLCRDDHLLQLRRERLVRLS